MHSVRHGIESLIYLGPKICCIVSQVMENSESLFVFQTKTKKCVPINYHCRLCRSYLQYVGYILKFLIFHPEISVCNGKLIRFSILKHFVLITSMSL